MRLHKKYGVAPTMLTCFFCGKEKGEIALLGSAWKGSTEPPMKMCMDHNPCDECAGYMKQGIILIAVKDPKREHFCDQCRKKWTAVVRYAEPGEITNIAGEKTEYCPQCGKAAFSSGPQISEDKRDPHRTGRWVVIKEEAFARIVGEDHPAIEARFCFIEDHVWDEIGLPKE